jgi:CheY-like chemotaxis protein
MERHDPPSKNEGPNPRKDTRRHPRERVTWPVTVSAGGRQLRSETVNVSPYGVKLRLKERIEPGIQVGLRLRPPGKNPFDVKAMVWRNDPDGTALLFLRILSEDFASPTQPVTPPLRPREVRPVETILLVDDDAESRALARAGLEGEGYTVLDVGGDPAAALRVAEEHPGPIHVLVSDILLPAMNGLHLVERVAPLRPTMKVLLLSAASIAGESASGTLFLPKPFTVDELLGKVRAVLAGPSPFAKLRPPRKR